MPFSLLSTLREKRAPRLDDSGATTESDPMPDTNPTTELQTTTTEVKNDNQISNPPTNVSRNGNPGQARFPINQDSFIVDAITDYVRKSLDDNTKIGFLQLAERIMERVIESEVRDAFAPRFEAMYEGVLANVMQRLLMQALTQRANDTIKQISRD